MTAARAARITALRWSLAVVALVLSATAVVGSLFGGYVRSQLISDRFVTATAPLAHDPHVRQLLADTVTAQVSGHLDDHALTSDINSILQHFGVGPVGAQASAIVRPYVVNYLASPQFDRVWTQVVTLAHDDLVTELHGGSGTALTVEGDTLRLDIRPIVAAVKQTLVDSGISAAKAVPDVSVQITLVTSPDVPAALRDGQWFARWSPWLPVAAVGLLGLALLAAPRRRRALLIGAAIGTVMFAGLLAAVPLARGWFGDYAAPRPPSTRPAVLDIFDVLAHPLITWTRIATAAGLAVTLALAVLSGLARRRSDATTDVPIDTSSDEETVVRAAAEPPPSDEETVVRAAGPPGSDETTVLLARSPADETVPTGETSTRTIRSPAGSLGHMIAAVVEIYVSTDVETDGPIPGPHSMLSFASAAYTADKTLVGTFSANLETLPGAAGDPGTMSWWAGQPEAWAACRTDLRPPAEAMTEYVTWLEALPGKPVFVAYPAGFDFMFVYWYLIRFAGRSPFSHSALDVKTLAMTRLGGGYRDATKRNMPRAWFDPLPHTHVALDDAIEQGALFCNILAAAPVPAGGAGQDRGQVVGTKPPRSPERSAMSASEPTSESPTTRTAPP